MYKITIVAEDQFKDKKNLHYTKSLLERELKRVIQEELMLELKELTVEEVK